MGVEGNARPFSPRLEGYEAALRIYGYPRSAWADLVDGAVLLHRGVHNIEPPEFETDDGRPLRFRDITPDTFAEGEVN